MLLWIQNLFPPRGSRITCIWNGEGAGSQVHSRLSTMIYAKLLGLTYVHSPLRNVARVEGGLDVETWSAKWEQFFNLGHCGERLDQPPHGDNVIFLRKPERTFLRPNRFYIVKHCHRISNQHPEMFAALADQFRASYYSTPKPALVGLNPQALNIAVHLRRGEITKDGPYRSRYIEADHAAAKVMRALDTLPKSDARPRVIHIHSEGKPSDFEPFRKLKAVLHLNEDAYTTFHHLVSADVLYMTKSSFTYLAAILSKGVCFYDPFWHPPLPGWRILPPD
jgi:hypothetical protein